MHEAALYDANCFVTLTYSDEHLPANQSLDYLDFQLFIKRLRRLRSGSGVRYFAAGEYGELGRPHFHAALFGEDFREDRKPWRKSGEFQVWRSATLEKLWPFGVSELGSLTPQSAGYIARYCLKKLHGANPQTGEVDERAPEMLHMSSRPGIGSRWYDRFASDVFPHDRVVVGGVPQKPPRYYDKKLARVAPELLEELKETRDSKSRANWSDNTPERLADKETVTKARVRLLKRGLQ